MKNKSIGKYLVYSLIGAIILASGAVLGKSTRNAEGIMQTLPYILIAIGAGIFGNNLSTAFNIHAIKKDPKLGKQNDITENDERNIVIRNKAKSKSYDFMVMAFGVLIIGFALMQIDMKIILAIIIVYILVILSNFCFTIKYHKEM